MYRKLLLAYMLFFMSTHAIAALTSIDCKTTFDSISVRSLPEYPLQCSNHANAEDSLQVDKISDDTVTSLHASNREHSASGSLTFILLIPALLVFVFSRFEKSNK